VIRWAFLLRATGTKTVTGTQKIVAGRGRFGRDVKCGPTGKRLEQWNMKNEDIVDTLAGLSLFADLGRPQLEAVAHTFTEEAFPPGQRVLRQGFTGSGFYVIVDGEVTVRINGEDRSSLGKGDFFGELSLLLGELPVADVIATSPLRVLHLAGPDLRTFLLRYPLVMFRMLQSVSRRLVRANEWAATQR